MIDTRCQKCGRRFGWPGRVLDAPPCPHCGHRIPAADLGHDHEQIEDFRRLLAERPSRTARAATRARARFAAGLTHGQAARILGVSVGVMFAVTAGLADPLPWFADRMREAYGLDPLPPEGGAP